MNLSRIFAIIMRVRIRALLIAAAVATPVSAVTNLPPPMPSAVVEYNEVDRVITDLCKARHVPRPQCFRRPSAQKTQCSENIA